MAIDRGVFLPPMTHGQRSADRGQISFPPHAGRVIEFACCYTLVVTGRCAWGSDPWATKAGGKTDNPGESMLRTVWLRSKGPSIGTWSVSLGALLAASLCLLGGARRTAAQQAPGKKSINLPSSKILLSPVPGHPQRTNSFPTAAVLSPDGRYLALLNNGRGTAESNYQQSIAILDLSTNQVTDFPDARLPVDARQTYRTPTGTHPSPSTPRLVPACR